MTTAFAEMRLHPGLVQAVAELGYTEPTPIQTGVIPLMLDGRDVIGQAQTGTGKTAAFALPMLHNLQPEQKSVQCLVLTPTRELAIQVSKAIHDYGRFNDAQVLAVYGGQAYNRQISRLNRGVQIVVGTPGRLLDLMRQNVLNLSSVHTVVLDEADEMLSMGFVEDIEAILSTTPAERQTALFSATLPPPIRRLADRYMRDPQAVTIQREQVTVAALEQRYYLVNESDRLAALTRLFEIEPITTALVFARTRASSTELANELARRGFLAEVLNGDLTQEARERVLNRFRQNQFQVLVATDVAARGLDIDDISHVFNYELPEEVEVYVHRVGRTGRAGKTGIAISLVTPAEQWRLRRIEGFTHQKLTRHSIPTEEDILKFREDGLLEKMRVWLGRARYRRERELVGTLVDEGFDPLEVASAALKIARGDEKTRPIAPVSEVVENRPRRSDRYERHDRSDHMHRDSRREHGERGMRGTGQRASSRGSTTSHEAGMVRLSLSKGREHGVSPNEVVSTIAYYSGIPGSSIGKIHILDRQTLVDVPQDYVGQVLAKTGNFRIRKQPVEVNLA